MRLRVCLAWFTATSLLSVAMVAKTTSAGPPVPNATPPTATATTTVEAQASGGYITTYTAPKVMSQRFTPRCP